jgi:hypothetical protein
LGVVQRITSAIFIMNGRLDRIVPCRDAAEGSARSGAVELVIARNGNQVANNRAYRLRPFGADWMTEQLRAAAQRQSAHGGISRELGKRSKGRTGSFLHPLRRPTRPTRQARDAPPTRQKSLGKAFSRLRDFDDRHLYVSRDRSRNDQSDHFIEHPRRCGSAAKDRLKPTKFGLCCNSATAKDFPSSGAIMGSAKRIFRIKISVHFIRNAGESHAQAVPYGRRRSGAAGTFDGGECR